MKSDKNKRKIAPLFYICVLRIANPDSKLGDGLQIRPDHEFVDEQMQKLIDEDADEFALAMIESAKETAEKAIVLSISL